jgi:hypothetical protein
MNKQHLGRSHPQPSALVRRCKRQKKIPPTCKAGEYKRGAWFCEAGGRTCLNLNPFATPLPQLEEASEMTQEAQKIQETQKSQEALPALLNKASVCQRLSIAPRTLENMVSERPPGLPA